jgi:hypothetical protein
MKTKRVLGLIVLVTNVSWIIRTHEVSRHNDIEQAISWPWSASRHIEDT